MSAPFPIDRILADPALLSSAWVREILERLVEIPLVTEGGRGGDRTGPQGMADDLGKDTLHLLDYRGEFLKPCPGTREYICCGYQILNVGTNCPLDCSYCILQAYFNQPHLRVFANLIAALPAVLATIDAAPHEIFRVGTGEFTDSLALDPITHWSDVLVPAFAARKNVILELKTKTHHIERLINLGQRDRIVVSWSLNSGFINRHEEHRAISLRARLEAARRCQEAGFVVGFHFDPLIPHPGWKEDYLRTVELMTRLLDPRRIIWISMGTFRFMPALKPIIRRRHPDSCILDGEFVLGLDGKLRYFKPIRIAMYRFLRQALEGWADRLGLYLCMESDEIWRESLGWSPETSAGLKHYLDERVIELFG